MLLERQLRPERFGRRRGGYLDRRRPPARTHRALPAIRSAASAAAAKGGNWGYDADHLMREAGTPIAADAAWPKGSTWVLRPAPDRIARATYLPPLRHAD